jgi:DNA (cytosine-5)-methyltransferase 1
VIALDLFAGTGWGVACQRLGIEEHGVEIMPEARAVRAANGMRTIYEDVWHGLAAPLTDEAEDLFSRYDLLIASPPCQTFSMAGGGAGRKALDEVLAAIDERRYLDPESLRRFGEEHDPRTALVLTPLAHIARDTPLYVVLEQVPPVLPVWERYAEEMRRWGYSVWTGNLQAEMYGVPQTRKRAVLIARADGHEAKAPTPTHSRYYSRDPKRLDPGVLPWVSMAEALGWGMTERPMVTAGNAIGRAEGIGGTGGKAVIVAAKERGAWLESNYTGNGSNAVEREGSKTKRGKRHADEPANVMTSKAGSQRRGSDPRPSPTVTGGGAMTGGAEVFGRHGRAIVEGQGGSTRVTVAEAATLQSYPDDFEWNASIDGKPITKTKQFLQIGNAVPPLLAEAILREVLS